MTHKLTHLCVCVSGGGTNCERLIQHFHAGDAARVVLVISNRADAYALVRAQRLGVETMVIDKAQLADLNYLRPILEEHGVDAVVLAGFLLMAPDWLIEAYPRRIINLHPALLPKFGGKGMWGHHVHEAVHAAHETETGFTVHHVTAVCDGGEIIAQRRVALLPTDTPDDIAAREHELEMAYFPLIVDEWLQNWQKMRE